MTTWLIANPKAGDGQRGAGFWQERLARAGVTGLTVCDFDQDDWMERVSADDRVLAAGGDGSVNRAASLCLRTGATLGILPSGTANDFARNLGLPDDPTALCELVASGRTHWLDVAGFDDQIFLNVAHIGLGTWPVRESSSQTKRLLGRFSYVATLLRKVRDKRGFRAVIECESGVVAGRWLSIVVATGAFFGGGNEIPEASANDGQLDIVAVKPRSLMRLFLTFLRVRIFRRSPGQTDTVVHLKSPWCRIDTHKPKTVTADGDVAGKTPLDVTCRPGCLKVICEQVVCT
ncbi:YegS/Rv2252/BmrU family lipid kinase [Marinobacter halodurans]|uniref:YegS/Rv2252/BmrU family lipid kinase n=1 Tax=Marinobacter halodurans TaxID=2528979 RepID=A0ABY1ZFB7_9GAMM|nr:YegS/Rv2252/BmrU family lipid kinase [Marinobacter halodurans]TBW49525.1 YegS/Rv2252/BmrU family lipid kinase [Marinobacter halodurans]